MQQKEIETNEALLTLYSYTKELLEELDGQIEIDDIPEMEFAKHIIQKYN